MVDEPIHVKQAYLRENILEKGAEYANEFSVYLQMEKGDNGLDINNWPMKDLKKVVTNFLKKKNQENQQKEETNLHEKNNEINKTFNSNIINEENNNNQAYNIQDNNNHENNIQENKNQHKNK